MEKLQQACQLLKQVKESDGALLILTGAGMSVDSGVPVFRNSDGSMSTEFLAFLGGYNKARRKHGLLEAEDWFDFSVPEMFEKETETEAWHYWRWRMLRACVEPSNDYIALNRLAKYFGKENVFVVTSNCDMLHVKAGADPNHLKEIHGSLGTLQCSKPCSEDLYAVDEGFVAKLSNKEDPDWVPHCPRCKDACLRPNVMIFSDASLVYGDNEKGLHMQANNYEAFIRKYRSNFVVLEVGAGTVVPSVRFEAEGKGSKGKGLIRVNPSQEECDNCNVGVPNAEEDSPKYYPLVSKSKEALEGLCKGLDLP